MNHDRLVTSAHPRIEAIGNRISNSTFRQRALSGAVAGALIAGGYAGMNVATDGESNSDAPAPELLDAEQSEQARELCNGEDLDMTTPIAVEFSQSHVGNDETAVLPKYVTQVDGNRVIAAPEDVARNILDIACESPTMLGIIDSAWLETSGYNEQGNRFLPDATLISRIQDNTEFFRRNNPAALNSLNKLASILAPSEGATEYDGGVEYTDDFTVVGGKAVMISPVRNENGEATDVALKTVLTDGLFDGYQIRFPEGMANTPEERAILDEISSLILITPNGEIIINSWIGESETSFTQETTPTTVEANVTASSADITAPENELTEEQSEEQSDEQTDEEDTGDVGTDDDRDREDGDGDEDEESGDPDGSGPSHAGPGTSQPGPTDTEPGGTTPVTTGTVPTGTTPTPTGTVPTGTTTVPPTGTTPTTVKPPTPTTKPPTTTVKPPTPTTKPPTTTTTSPPPPPPPTTTTTTTTTEAPKGTVPLPDCNTNPNDNIPDC